MKCQKCGIKDAIYHSTIIVNGDAKEEHLCYDCASNFRNNLNTFDILDGLFEFGGNFNFKNKLNKLNLFNNDYLSEKKYCYANSKNLIDKANNQINIGAKKYREKIKTNDEIKVLESRMKLAIESENYEYAGMLKKEIEKIKDNIN